MNGRALRWDIFCHVVDNYGDVGVCWRLATQLAAQAQRVRLWVDDATALAWMAPVGCPGVTVVAGQAPGEDYEAAEVVIEAFGAALPPAVIAAIARANGHSSAAHGRRVAWINLEYLSAEDYVARSHGLASPVHGGPAAGMRKWFFFPGFTADSGGLLREPGLLARRARFDRAAWLAQFGAAVPAERIVVLFCYEPAVLPAWLHSLAQEGTRGPVRLLVTHGRPRAAVRAALDLLPADANAAAGLRITYLPALQQTDFDHLLWSADCNFVRGEDSLVRAIWAGAPFVWQIYPQDDGVHQAKLAAFLRRVGLDTGPSGAAVGQYSRWWNDAERGPPPPADWDAWAPDFAAARARLLAQDDLVTRLLRFVAENR